jgi:transposase
MSYSVDWRCRMRPYGSPAHLEQRRLEAINLFRDGTAPVEIARRLGVDRRSVRRWKSSYLQKGRDGIKAKPVPGRPSRLSLGAKRRLERELLRGAQCVGYPTSLWTCPRVAHLIQKKFRVNYHSRYVPRLLRSLGWSPQKPECRARERDEEAIRHWVKVVWPQIKKKPAN